mmetsp:Transcript_10409/g.22213  ORF Transcript_10409/g.22213 Transcript_10409/m.22213 type:complete len:120 (-) Transcript_10409:67-426(-)
MRPVDRQLLLISRVPRSIDTQVFKSTSIIPPVLDKASIDTPLEILQLEAMSTHLQHTSPVDRQLSPISRASRLINRYSSIKRGSIMEILCWTRRRSIRPWLYSNSKQYAYTYKSIVTAS